MEPERYHRIKKILPTTWKRQQIQLQKCSLLFIGRRTMDKVEKRISTNCNTP
jgi:hypothetical protein